MRQLPIMMLLLALSFRVSGNAQMKFSLTSEKQQYRAGEPIQLSWKLYNGTNRSWVVYRATEGVRESFPQITFNIEGPSGRRALSLQGNEKATDFDACRLSPGQTLQVGFDLAEWLTLKEYRIVPGKYGVSATLVQRAGEYAGILVGTPVAKCGSSQPGAKAEKPEIWDGTLAAPQISFTVR